MNKVAILELADAETHGDLGRVVNALMTPREVKEAGDTVELVFDGGTADCEQAYRPFGLLGRRWIHESSRCGGRCGSADPGQRLRHRDNRLARPSRELFT
jgi:hypothetical protein